MPGARNVLRRLPGTRAGKLLGLVTVLLPWPLKRAVLEAVWGYDLAPDAFIGLSYVYPGHLQMGPRARIGHLNVCINLGRMVIEEGASLGRSNWVTGHPPDGTHFRARLDRDPALVLGRNAAVTKHHLIDCTDRVEIGPFTTVAGYRTQVLTHAIDLAEARQDCRPVRIGASCLLGTRATILGGAVLPDFCVLGAGAVLNKAHVEQHTLYAGQPAVARKRLDPDARYFHRTQRYVD